VGHAAPLPGRAPPPRARLPALLAFLAVVSGCSTDPTFVGGAGNGGAGAAGSGAPGSGGAPPSASATSGGAGGCGAEGCERCARDCLGGACVDGKCQPVAILDRSSGLEGTWSGILADGPDLFVGDLGSGEGTVDGQLVRIDKTSGGVTILVAKGGTTAWELAADAERVFWLSPTEARVQRVARTGGPMLLIAKDQPPSASDEPSGIAVSEGFVYWAAFGTWRRAAVGSSEAESDFEAGTSPASIASGGKEGGVFLTDRDGWVYGKDTPSTLTALATGGKPGALAVDSTHVYWVDGDDSSVARVSRNGLERAQKLAEGAARPTGIALDATHVYWTTRGDCEDGPACWSGSVTRIDKAGDTKPEVMAEGPWPVFDVAVDDDAVYFTTGPAGVVYRVAK
jgi:hypothetical protein